MLVLLTDHGIEHRHETVIDKSSYLFGHFLRVTLKKISFFILAWLTYSTIVIGQETLQIEVSVTGLDPILQKNVLASLSIIKQKNNPHLTDFLVHGLIEKSTREAAAALEPFGYYSPDITSSQERIDDVWKVALDIYPGEPVLVSTIHLELAGKGRQEKQILQAVDGFPLQSGDVLAHQLYEKGKKELTARAIASGFRGAAFTRHTVEVNRENRSAVISLVLDTGPLYRFGPTTFDADFLTQAMLARMLPYKEGDPYNPRLLVQLRQSLYNSDYFSSVEVSAGEADKNSLEIPIRVALKPGLRNKYGFGVGYGTDTGVRGTIDWTNRRLNRYGHQLNVTLQPSERKSYFGGVYTIPIKNPRKDRLSWLVKWEKEDFENTETEQRSTSLSYDHIRKAGEYSVYLKFLDEDYDTGWETGHSTLLMPGLKTTIRLANDRLATKKGVRATFDLTGAGNEILSDTSFIQASISSKAIYTFFSDWRLIGKFDFGGTLIDTIYELPPSLRFYAGGDQSVRGYSYKSISPRDPFGNVLGGRYFMTYSLEIERTLFDNWSGALFFDSGDAYNAFENLAMKHGAGFGIRWNAPFGQVRIDIADALSEGGNSWRIHFNVGADL